MFKVRDDLSIDKSGWKMICGYNCLLDEDGLIKWVLDQNGNQRFLWKPYDKGLTSIPRCTVSRFRRGIKTGSVVIR